MARRRKKNPLLMKILLISLAAHAVALPILAHYGAFEKIQKAFGASNVVMLTPAPEQTPPPKAAKEAKKQVSQAAQHKGSSQPSHGAPHPHSNLNQPAVVASGPGQGAAGPAVDQGTGRAGELPTPKSPGPGSTPAQPQPTTTPAPKAAEPTPNPIPTPTPKAAVPNPIPKHAPVYREAEPTYQPEPVIPDDLRQDALDKICVLELTVNAAGAVSEARVTSSCGIRDLDDIAIRTAKTWRFDPATADGSPIEGKVCLRIEFKVE